MVWDELTEAEELWRSLHLWLKGNVSIYVNIDEADVKDYPFLQQFLSKWAEGSIKLFFDPNLFAKVKENNPCQYSPFVIIFSDNEADVFVEHDYGLELISSVNFDQKWELLGKAKTDTVSKSGTIKSIKDLSKYKHHFNSIVIIDRYIFKGYNYAENVKNLVSSLMENSDSTFTFNVTILSEVNSDLESIHNNVKKSLEVKFIKQNFYLTIANIQRDRRTHDRRIITNYTYFFSGDSFSHYQRKDINTQLHYDPMGETRKFAVVGDTLNQFKKLISGTKNVPNQKRIIQEGQNYLLNS